MLYEKVTYETIGYGERIQKTRIRRRRRRKRKKKRKRRTKNRGASRVSLAVTLVGIEVLCK